MNKTKSGQKILFLVIFTSILFLSLSASSLATAIVSDSGSNVRNKVNGSLLDNGDLKVDIFSQITGGSAIYTKTFPGVINDGAWRITLGLNGGLSLDYDTIYYKAYTINGEQVTFTNYSGGQELRTRFQSPFGFMESSFLPTCDDGDVAEYNISSSNWSCAEDDLTTLPTCGNTELLKYNSSINDWSCKPEIHELPNCAEDSVISVKSGSFSCTSPQELSLNVSEIENAVGDWASDSADYYTSSQVNSQISTETSSFLNSAEINSQISTETAALVNASEVSAQISSEGFSGDWGDMAGIPADIADGDSNTQLNQSEVASYVNSQWINLDTNSSDDFSGIYGDLSDTPDFVNISEMETYVGSETSTFVNSSDVSSQISSEGFSGDYGDLSNPPESINQSEMEEFIIEKDFINISDLIGYATETYVDNKQFSINWSNVTSIPADIADGDDDTILDNSTIIEIINNSGFASESYVSTQTFSGSFSDLTDKPAGLDDGDDNTQLNQSEVAIYTILEWPSLDTNASDDFSGNYTDLSSSPNLSNYDTNVSDDFDGDYFSLSSKPTIPVDLSNLTDGTGLLFSESFNDLINIPPSLDTNASDDFDANWSSLTDKPAGLDDGDDNTQLNQSEVASYVNSQWVNLDTNYIDDLVLSDVVNSIGNWSEDKTNYYNQSDIDGMDFINTSAIEDFTTESFVNDSINSINYSEVNNTPDFTGWDSNASDDFDFNFTSLISIPNGLDDGDDNTQLNQSEVSTLIGLEWPSLDTNASDDFDGNYTNLMDKPTLSTDLSNLTDNSNLLFSRDYNDLTNKISFGIGFSSDGNNINLSFNESIFKIEHGKLTLGSNEGCPMTVGATKELAYDCSSGTWSWEEKPMYLLDSGDSATGSYIFDNKTLVINSNHHMVGIGTKHPEYDLHLQTDTNSSLRYGLLLQNPNTTVGSSIGILFGTDSNTSYTKGALVYERNNTNGRGDFHFLQEYHTSSSLPDLNQAVMTIKNKGNVGIGDKTPVVKLDVNGLIRTAPQSSATCNITTEGSMYYDTEDKTFYGCNSTTWLTLN
ncbi:MAG: hypothetical protein KAH32_08065 [Chlamydiia bacterium]|nr:hypothetical protein [Chlamydiia bacterium]